MASADKIKYEIRIEQLVNYLGLRPNRAGFLHCPRHTDKTASLKVYPKSDSWFCFSCRKGGTVIDLYMHFYNVDFSTAANELGQIFGISDRKLSLRKQVELAKRDLAYEKELTKEDELDFWYNYWLALKEIQEEDHTEWTPELVLSCRDIAYAEYMWQTIEEEIRNA